MANFYVIGNGAAQPNLAGTPYEGYKVVTQSQIDGPWISRFELDPGDKVVVSGSTSGSINLHPKYSFLGVQEGQPVDVTILPNSNKALVNFQSNGGREFNPTVNVTGDASNVSIDGKTTQNMTVNVADKAAIADVYGGNGKSDVDTITTGAGSTIGNIDTGDGDDNITIGGKAGNIDAGGGSDRVTLENGATVGSIALGTGGAMGDTIKGGNDVTINGDITQANSKDYSITNLGDNTKITGNVDLSGGKDQMTLGKNSVVEGSITMGSDWFADDADTLKIGAGSTIKKYINTNNGDDTVIIGENTTLLGGWNSINTYRGNDTVIIGKGVVATNPIFTGAGSDRVVIEGDGKYTVDMGYNLPNDDTLEWNYKPGTEAEFNKMMTSKGYTYNSRTGTWYRSSNSDTTLGGVTIVDGDYIKGITCFTPGMMIATDRGPVAVEALKVGDLVATRDNGLQPIRWIGAQRLSAAELKLAPQLRPVRISAGALGGGLPEADLVVSPWHRMVVRSSIVAEMEGEDEALVAAINLSELDGVDVITDGNEVVYIHFMCDRHEVIEANGAQTETLNIGTSTASMMPPESLAEILHLFPELADGKPQPTVRRTVPGPRGRWMVQRHVKAGLPMVG